MQDGVRNSSKFSSFWKKSDFSPFQFVYLLPRDITAASVLSVIPLMYNNEEKLPNAKKQH